MRFVHASAVAIVVALFVPGINVHGQDADKKVAGGGIAVKGWQGKVDANNKQGLTINDSKFAAEGGGFRITTGGAGVYWNPANTGKGDFTVKATFKEAKQTYNHPHPFGVFIAGKALDTDQPSYLYCVAYRDGNYLVRQFTGGTVTTIAKRAPSDAVDKATGPEDDVTQEVGWTVKGTKADCSINGKVVYSIDRADPAGLVKIDSFDGVYGIRTSHNSDVVVSGLGLSK
jgi:hypothetical protein